MIQSVNLKINHFNFVLRSNNMSQLIDFTVYSFLALKDFSVDALKWTDLEGVVYQITSTRTVNTQHGQPIVLSLQSEGGSCCTVWACGILSTELLLNPMLLVNSRLFVVATGKKTSKTHGRIYNSYKLMTL